jgi:hypothetical protein
MFTKMMSLRTEARSLASIRTLCTVKFALQYLQYCNEFGIEYANHAYNDSQGVHLT